MKTIMKSLFTILTKVQKYFDEKKRNKEQKRK